MSRVAVSGRVTNQITQNLFIQSEDFGNAAWTKTNITSITSAAVAGPLPSSVGDAIIASATNGVHTVARIPTAMSTAWNAQPSCLSVYAKAGAKTWLCLSYNNIGIGAWFNLSTGVTGTVTNVTARIRSAGNGWYRCIIFAPRPNHAAFSSFNFATSDNTTTFAGDAVTISGYLCGAQATTHGEVPYTKTTTVVVGAVTAQGRIFNRSRTAKSGRVAP